MISSVAVIISVSVASSVYDVHDFCSIRAPVLSHVCEVSKVSVVNSDSVISCTFRVSRKSVVSSVSAVSRVPLVSSAIVVSSTSLGFSASVVFRFM